MIKFSHKELTDLVEDQSSSVKMQTLKQILTLHASCLINVKKSVLESLSNAIGKFDKRLDGVILSYGNVKICTFGMIRNDSPDVHYEVEADFYVFQPCIGTLLRGMLNRKCDTHLSLIVHKVFNVVIPRPVNQGTLTWSDTSWVGSKLKVGQEVPFRIELLDLHCQLPYIRGAVEESFYDSLLFEEDESNIIKKPKRNSKRSSKSLENHNLTELNIKHNLNHLDTSSIENVSNRSKHNLSSSDVDETYSSSLENNSLIGERNLEDLKDRLNVTDNSFSKNVKKKKSKRNKSYTSNSDTDEINIKVKHDKELQSINLKHNVLTDTQLDLKKEVCNSVENVKKKKLKRNKSDVGCIDNGEIDLYDIESNERKDVDDINNSLVDNVSKKTIKKSKRNKSILSYTNLTGSGNDVDLNLSNADDTNEHSLEKDVKKRRSKLKRNNLSKCEADGINFYSEETEIELNKNNNNEKSKIKAKGKRKLDDDSVSNTKSKRRKYNNFDDQDNSLELSTNTTELFDNSKRKKSKKRSITSTSDI